MGKPNPILVVWVWHPWISRPEIGALHDAGHSITAIGREGGLIDISGDAASEVPDMILHPAAHGWDDTMWDFLPVALKAARKRRKERK